MQSVSLDDDMLQGQHGFRCVLFIKSYEVFYDRMSEFQYVIFDYDVEWHIFSFKSHYY